jgi:hypothetical protein
LHQQQGKSETGTFTLLAAYISSGWVLQCRLCGLPVYWH